MISADRLWNELCHKYKEEYDRSRKKGPLINLLDFETFFFFLSHEKQQEDLEFNCSMLKLMIDYMKSSGDVPLWSHHCYFMVFTKFHESLANNQADALLKSIVCSIRMSSFNVASFYQFMYQHHLLKKGII
jgi:hypothetical protein